MTEYATDPEAIQEFLSARDRTAQWVTRHADVLSFASPSSPPSMLSDEDALSLGPSESEASSHSLPPRMVLRYEDGRPDIPVSHDPTYSSAHARGHPPPSSSRHRSRSGPLPAPPPPVDLSQPPARYAQTLSYASGSRFAPAGQPENIRVLPSRQAEDSQRIRAPGSSHHSRVPVPPAQAVFPPQQPSIHDRASARADPLHTSNRSALGTSAMHIHSASHPIPVLASPTSSQSRSPTAPSGSRFYEQMASSQGPSGLPYHYSPPSIVYAPSGRHSQSKYQPPAIVYSPSSHGHRRAPAPGIAYSRSDPLPHPTQYSPVQSAGHTPFPSAQGSTSRSRPRAHSTAGPEQNRGRSRGPMSARDRTRTRSPTPSLSESDTSSDSSGSTYYVLPSPGQKVQIIVPNSATVYTATAGRQSSRSPRSPGGPSPNESPKKPFFARLFSRGSASGSVDSRGSSGQARGERGRLPVPWR